MIVTYSYMPTSIVFSFWTTTLELICTALREIEISYTRVDGTMTSKERQHSLKSLTEDTRVRVILISLRCGSTGYLNPRCLYQHMKSNIIRLNLTAANHVFLMEPQWNPMLEDQAFDRVYRIGQTKEVTTIRYIVKGTFEEVCCRQSINRRNDARLNVSKSIRHQQLKKRNMAEHAFVLAKRNDNWIEVSMSISYGRASG